MTTEKQQIWNDHLGNLFIELDEEVTQICGKDWARTHVMRCAVCEKIIFGYERVEHPRVPYENRLKEVCEHPLCVATQEREWLRTNRQYQETCRNYYASKAAHNGETDETESAIGGFKLTKLGAS